MTDAETAAAIDALVHRLRLRDEAMRDSEDYADPEVFAAEYVAAMRGHGWRPTEAKVFPTWKPGQVGSGHAPEGLLDSLRADLDAKADAFKAAQKAREDEAEGAA